MGSASSKKRFNPPSQSHGSKPRGGPTDGVMYGAWFRREVQAGIDAANAGDLVPDSEVEAEAQAWRREIARNSGRSRA